jgi:hypothetical protein
MNLQMTFDHKQHIDHMINGVVDEKIKDQNLFSGFRIN